MHVKELSIVGSKTVILLKNCCALTFGLEIHVLIYVY